MTDYIQSKLKEWSIEKEEMDITEPEAIIEKIWNRLRDTHRIKIIK